MKYWHIWFTRGAPLVLNIHSNRMHTSAGFDRGLHCYDMVFLVSRIERFYGLAAPRGQASVVFKPAASGFDRRVPLLPLAHCHLNEAWRGEGLDSVEAAYLLGGLSNGWWPWSPAGRRRRGRLT